MEFTFNLDMHAIVAAATAPEKIQPILDKAVTEAIKSAISDATGWNSEFQKALKLQVAEAMPRGLAIDDAAKLQHLINATVSQAIASENSDSVKVAIDQSVIGAISKLPQSIKLSELMELAREGFHKEKHEAFYAEMEETSYGFRHLYLDSNDGLRLSGGKYKADYQLDIDKDSNVYALKFDGHQVLSHSVPKVISHLDAIVFGMYVGRVKLEVDIDCDDVAAAAEEQYD